MNGKLVALPVVKLLGTTMQNPELSVPRRVISVEISQVTN